jgi:glycerol kinase
VHAIGNVYLDRMIGGYINLVAFHIDDKIFVDNIEQADLLATPVIRPTDIETTALGAAYAAGLAVGVWKEDYIFDSKDRLKNANIFRPLMPEDSRKKKADSWSKAVSRSFDLADLSL